MKADSRLAMRGNLAGPRFMSRACVLPGSEMGENWAIIRCRGGSMLRFFGRLRRCRPAIAMLAALVALQSLGAGLALVESSIALTPALGDFAVICHGGGGGDAGSGTAPEPIKVGHFCCPACTGSGPPAVLAGAPVAVRTAFHQLLNLPPAYSNGIAIAARAVRAGLSQAPP